MRLSTLSKTKRCYILSEKEEQEEFIPISEETHKALSRLRKKASEWNLFNDRLYWEMG